MIQKMVFTCLMLASSVAALPGGALGMGRPGGDADQGSTNTGARAKARTKESLWIEALEEGDVIPANRLWIVSLKSLAKQKNELINQLRETEAKGQLPDADINEIEKQVTPLSETLEEIQGIIDAFDPSPAPASQASGTSSLSSATASPTAGLINGTAGRRQRSQKGEPRTANDLRDNALRETENILSKTEKFSEECKIQ